MYVVRRSFKSLGKVYTVGSVITEPTSIKRFDGKLAEGKIIEVTKQTYDSTAKYFKEKFGVELPPIEKPIEHEKQVDKEPEKPATTDTVKVVTAVVR